MKRIWLWLITLSLTAACTVAAPSTPLASPTSAPVVDLARTDTQGAVEFTVTPLNLQTNATTLEFQVVMDTHSVDLSWDLAAQAMLKTDTGLEVAGSQWAAGSGHHYENLLIFPAQTKAGQSLLAAAKTLTLVIRNTDVPERTFVWELNP